MSGGDVLNAAQRLGARLRKVGGAEWCGPCPRCGGRDRFGVNTTRNVWNCRGCAVGGDAIDLVRHSLGVTFREAVDYLDLDLPARSKTSDEIRGARAPAEAAGLPTANAAPALDPDKIRAARDLWQAGVDPRQTVAEAYMRSRALEIGDDLAMRVLRFHAETGALLAKFSNIHTGEGQAVSRTFLTPSGVKIERKFLGPVGCAAIMLDAFDDVLGGLHIGEGVETGMAARQLGLRPCWALGSAGAVASFPVLGGVEALTILAEHDDASAKATQACATRWHEAGREVFINRATKGKDLADAIKGSVANG